MGKTEREQLRPHAGMVRFFIERFFLVGKIFSAMTKKLSLLMVGWLFFVLANYAGAQEAKETKVITYPAPVTEKVLSTYTITVNGKPLDIYKALSPKFEGGEYYFTYFDFEGVVDVKVVSRKPMKKAELFPEIFKAETKDGVVSFKADKPFKVVVIRNERRMPLVIFGNAIEKDVPSKDDPNVVYFGPGLHIQDKIDLKSNQTLYIAGGAVVKSVINANGDNITVCGRGILSTDNRERFYSGVTNFIKCKNLKIRDIIIKDTMSWSLVFRDCNGVLVEGLNICTGRMINDDGIDICNSSNVVIRNCFVRAEDDIIAIKGMAGDLPCENMVVEDSILWTDSANTFRIGYECHTPAMTNLKCRNLYVPFYSEYVDPEAYWSHAIIWLQATNEMPMTNMHFDGIHIRSNGEDMPLMIANPRITNYRGSKTAGRVADITIKNVKVTGKKGAFKGMIYAKGRDAEHDVKNITLENINYFGEKIKQDSPSVFIGEHTSNIVVK